MFELKSNSIKVVDGRLCRSDGSIMNIPSMLIYDGRVVGYGDLDSLRVSLLKIHSCYEKNNKDMSKVRLFGFDMGFAKDFSISDVCYLFRRSIEVGDKAFIVEMCKRWNSVSFWNWVREERKIFKIEIENNSIRN